MESIVLLQITSLLARCLPESGLMIRQRGIEIMTGPIVASLDESAPIPANTGIVDLATGAIRLQWAVIATLPFLADAFASGTLSPKDSAPVRATFDESGRALDDGSGFDVKGKGRISPGSILSAATVPAHQNPFGFVGIDSLAKFGAALNAGNAVRCAFASGSAVVDLKLPKALGGGTQRLTLTGGFVLAPLLTLERPDRTKRSRR
jgi:hypothetical protein